MSIYLARWKASVDGPVYVLPGAVHWKYGWTHVVAPEPGSAEIHARNKARSDLEKAGFKVSEVIILETERL